MGCYVVWNGLLVLIKLYSLYQKFSCLGTTSSADFIYEICNTIPARQPTTSAPPFEAHFGLGPIET
jgi:hypothetical protein